MLHELGDRLIELIKLIDRSGCRVDRRANGIEHRAKRIEHSGYSLIYYWKLGSGEVGKDLGLSDRD